MFGLILPPPRLPSSASPRKFFTSKFCIDPAGSVKAMPYREEESRRFVSAQREAVPPSTVLDILHTKPVAHKPIEVGGIMIAPCRALYSVQGFGVTCR